MDKRCMIINEAREMYFINQIAFKAYKFNASIY